MSAILPTIKIDSQPHLAKHFTPYQLHWILAEDELHAQGKQVYAIAEKSVRIGWTFCDGFKNVRKRLLFKKRDYLFATRDLPSALEYMNQVYAFAEFFNLTGSVLSHGEEYLKLPRVDEHGRPTSFTEETKVGVIKFDNGSRIIAFSSNPQAMAVYGGDVGLDEFAKHPNAHLLWEVAQGRITWNGDIAVWSSHDGEDTLFYQFCLQARAKFGVPQFHTPSPNAVSDSDRPADESSSAPQPKIENQNSKFENPKIDSPWNLYYRVTMPDALDMGLLAIMNRTTGSRFTRHQFLADCQARSGSEETFQQAYLCNPLPRSAGIVDWSAIELCRADYQIERVHLEHHDILSRFGHFRPESQTNRQHQIDSFLTNSFPSLLSGSSHGTRNTQHVFRNTRVVDSDSDAHSKSRASETPSLRLGFDIAASGQGDLAAFYIDQVKGSELWLAGLLTARTDDWHFLKTALFFFLRRFPSISAAGDESGLGRQICWEAASTFGSRFLAVNFGGNKSDLGFALMNQLAAGQKRFPKSEQDIAADFFALRKAYTGTKWVFTESRNSFNPASHCDIAWAAALASHAHAQRRCQAGAMVVYDTPEEQEDAANNRIYHWDRPADPNMIFTLACAWCKRRPGHFAPPPAVCAKCGLFRTEPQTTTTA